MWAGATGVDAARLRARVSASLDGQERTVLCLRATAAAMTICTGRTAMDRATCSESGFCSFWDEMIVMIRILETHVVC